MYDADPFIRILASNHAGIQSSLPSRVIVHGNDSRGNDDNEIKAFPGRNVVVHEIPLHVGVPPHCLKECPHQAMYIRRLCKLNVSVAGHGNFASLVNT